ncbi:MAG: selenide, water dikinase SelD [Hahellaceae bacterium]|nr:selenide, water dikinase SelD [Hahellaceae bacterium]MCP5169775.1 selenide, water dikinase SelD [Hahellaceae bacterium]
MKAKPVINSVNNSAVAAQQDLVLLGGGHSHALVLLQWAQNPLPDVRVTLVSEYSISPYSGMLPGLVAGHYTHEEVHIDLRRLCQFAGVRFIQARVTGLRPETKDVLLEGRPVLSYDVLSINSGATPDLTVPGAQQFVVPVKPIATFWPRWQALRDQLLSTNHVQDIAVVGGGAGSVELALAMAYRLKQARVHHRIHLVTRGEALLPGYPARMHRWLAKRLIQSGISVHCDAAVIKVSEHGLHTADGLKITANEVFWCTQAIGAPWLAASGLACTTQGFIRVTPALQSLDDPAIFAAGDCAWIEGEFIPRAGVYAVRQAPTLFKNLRTQLQHPTPGEARLSRYRPQKHFLSLLATGDRDAVGARGSLSLAGRWVWRWKDRIDRRFMAMLQQLPVMPPPAQRDEATLEPPGMRCGGCGSKVGANLLQQALQRLDEEQATCSLSRAEDAAVIEVNESSSRVWVQSIDALKPMIDDPWLFARITTCHALSDLAAMHTTPHSAQLQLQIPIMAERLQLRDLQQLLSGVTQALSEVSASLLGGHTTEGDGLSIGLTVNGFADRSRLLNKQGAQVGDVLILTKALGTGALFAASMRGAARADAIEAALACMLQNNFSAADRLAEWGATAMTDVTGFGLVGHLLEMLAGQPLAAHLSLAALPLLPGVEPLLQQGYQSTLAPANRRLRHAIQCPRDMADEPRYSILFDPQTSGGLLATVPLEQAESCVKALRDKGIAACQVGHMVRQISDDTAKIILSH